MSDEPVPIALAAVGPEDATESGPPAESDPALEAAYQAAARAIRAARHVAVVCHEQPDGDAIGSLTGLAGAIGRLGRPVLAITPDPVPESIRFIPEIDRLTLPLALPASIDLLVTVDANELHRTGDFLTLNADRLLRLPIVNLDHHITNSRFGAVNVVDLGAAATCEMILRLLRLLGVEPAPPIGFQLATGLITDTLGFRTPSTTPATLRAAADLAERGVELTRIFDLFYRNRRLATLRLWGLALTRLREDRGIVWTVVTRAMLAEAGARPEDVDGLNEVITSVGDARATALFKVDEDGLIRVSLRARAAVDVAAVALRLGGGGHPRAAGAEVGRDLAEAERRVLALLLAE